MNSRNREIRGCCFRAPQCCDTEAVCILKFDSLPVGRLLKLQSQRIFYLIINKENSLLACPGHTSAVLEVKKRKWPPPTLTFSSLPESLLRDKRSSAFLVDRQLVGNWASSGVLPVVKLELDRFRMSLRAKSMKSAAPMGIAGFLDSNLECVREKSKGIEDGTLAHAILADDGGEWRKGADVPGVPELAERDISEYPVVLNAKAFKQCHDRSLGMWRKTVSADRSCHRHTCAGV